MAVPLAARGRVLGAVTFVSGVPRRYGPRELRLAQELVHRIALAIDNARLYREAQDSIRARDEFLSIASHELRTPLTSLRLVVGHGRDNPAKAFQMVDRQISRLSRLVEGMLDVGQIAMGPLALHLGEVDLVAVVRQAVRLLEADLARARCPLELLAPAPVMGRWDPDRLEQVVTNLLSNAIKFGAGKPIQMVVEERAGSATLRVRDQGIGIPPERLQHVFERFERAVSVREYGGLGLGLYLARELVRAHGGTLSAQSELGGGSTFTVELPCRGTPTGLPKAREGGSTSSLGTERSRDRW
jgi:signal transduction histidine kinase